jgi:hypothetical protein
MERRSRDWRRNASVWYVSEFFDTNNPVNRAIAMGKNGKYLRAVFCKEREMPQEREDWRTWYSSYAPVRSVKVVVQPYYYHSHYYCHSYASSS